MKQTTEQAGQQRYFPVVGIGAREGSIGAIVEVTRKIAPESGMSYLISYYGESQEGNLAEMVAREAKIPVKEIVSSVELAPDHIYIVPPSTRVTAEYGLLKLTAPSRDPKATRPVDCLFTSLAEAYKSRAMAVVLSGASFDGASGLKVVKEFGGATIVQDPRTASFSSMPLAAVDSCAADYILPPGEIAEKLLKIRQTYESTHGYTEREDIPDEEEEVLTEIKKVVLLRTGHDFQHYKKPTLRRRIARRMVMAGREHLSDYLNHLRNDTAEQEQLFNDFLIPVSYFFRDPKVFEAMASDIFPRLFEKADGTLRFWVAGCSTGEEAYSLAICLHEFMQARNKHIRIQVFASDISPDAISKARIGAYAPQDLQNVSQSRLENYFIKRDGVYHVKKAIRDMCVFAIHNLASDTPFTRIDMISCRNVLIYFDSYLQERVLDTFHYALREGGFLLLGKSESTAASPLFDTARLNEKFYVRKSAPPRLPSLPFRPSNYTVKQSEAAPRPKPANFPKLIADILLPRYATAYTVINMQHDIVHFEGDTAAFLQPPSGGPSFNLLRMARNGLSAELRGALALAKGKGGSVKRERIAIPDTGFLAGFEVVPLEDGTHTLVIFKRMEITPPAKGDRQQPISKEKRIIELEDELSALQEDVRRITEEHREANDALQVSNEELLAGNEELHILNEELQASAEELQAGNEELTCVNDELIDRHEQLLSMRHYAESIIDTIHEPLVVIAKDMRIKSMNPAFARYFSTEEEIVGRSIFEIGERRWDIPELRQLLENVLEKNATLESHRLSATFPEMGERTLMLNARQIVAEKPSNLILLAIADITEIEAAHGKLLEKNNELEYYNEQLKSFSWAASHDLQEPLRKIIMFSRMIAHEDAGISEKSRFGLQRIALAAENMATLIRDLMDYTTTIKPEEPLRITDLNVLLKRATAELKETLKEHNAVIDAKNLPRMEVRPEQFKQLLSNLIVNSITYRRDGVHPRIEISASFASSDEVTEFSGNPELAYHKVTLRDNGIGFDQAHAEKIFHPFYRLHGKDKYCGSGLGLTLCRQIVRNHEGVIRADCDSGHGAVVTIYLPMRRAIVPV